MRSIVGSILAVSLLGAVHSVRRDRAARFAAVPLPGSAALHAATIGSPLSAPPLMLIGLAVAAQRGHRDIVRVLAGVLIVGILGEPDTWTTLRRPSRDPVGTACTALDVVLPALLIARRPDPSE
jgi:hypothetical protein